MLRSRHPRSASSGRPAHALLALAAGASLLAPSLAGAISQRVLFTAIGDPNTFTGISISGGGDLNGDGFPDVVAGATGNGSTIPRVCVYFGGPAADGVADLMMAPRPGIDFGQAVTSAADLNGDGYADLAVGSFHDAPGKQQAGRVYIYFGGAAFDTIPDLILDGETAFGDFGWSLASGDVNGDGYADLIVGAIFADRAYVFWGGPLLDATPDLRFTGEAAGDWFGQTVGAGDFNGDGFADVIVGALINDGDGADAGRAYVFYGGPRAGSTPDLVLHGEAAGDNFGSRVAGAGDVNRDGYGDFLVSANGHDGFAAADAGRVYLYLGGTAPDAQPDLVIDGEAAGDGFGRATGAGDVDGDGYADFAAGALLNDAFGTDAGRAYLFLGAPKPHAIPSLVLTGTVAGGRLGRTASAGDLNGDGYGDLVVSAFTDSTGGPQAGRLFAVLLYPYQILSPNGGEQWVTGSLATVRWLGRDLADLDLSLDGGASWERIANGVGGADSNEVQVLPPDSPTSDARLRVVYSGETASHSTSVASAADFAIVPQPVSVPAAPGAPGLRIWPSPLRPGAVLHVALGAPAASASDLDLAVFDLAGRRIATLAAGTAGTSGGIVQLEWKPPARLATGLYALRATAPSAGLRTERRFAVVR